VAGFIGSLLSCELCDAGFEVIGVDNFVCGYEKNLSWIKPSHNFTFYRLDVGDAAVHPSVRKDDIFIHLASISALATCQENPQVAYTNNVANTAGLLQLARV
jgi:nucleoside-diphosphate-sugar epimerase